MIRTPIRVVLEASWVPHTLCCLLALLSCVPLLWPDLVEPKLQTAVKSYAGALILASLVGSAILVVASCVHFFLKLNNLKALWQVCTWGIQWGIAALIFAQMAIEADVSSPFEQEASHHPIQNTDTLHIPSEKLTGPTSLTIAIDPTNYGAEVIEDTPNLIQLEQEHEELLSTYLSQSPRWAHATQTDTFYTKPGHVVLLPPATGGIPGAVHAIFRTVAEGEALPAGFVQAAPGTPFPQAEEGQEGVPDIALQLSGKHQLLLAWRGTKHRETACKALNAAIAAIDTRMQGLLDSPTPETLQRLCEGKRSILGNNPELRVCEPVGQYGVYQAEVYANPGREGTMLLAIRDMQSEDKTILRLFSFPAQYSDNPNELFRHDIPGASARWTRDAAVSDVDTIFPHGAPYFAIKAGESHQYFGVTFEVQFSPKGTSGKEADVLLRRNYKVQAYEATPEQ